LGDSWYGTVKSLVIVYQIGTLKPEVSIANEGNFIKLSISPPPSTILSDVNYSMSEELKIKESQIKKLNETIEMNNIIILQLEKDKINLQNENQKLSTSFANFKGDLAKLDTIALLEYENSCQATLLHINNLKYQRLKNLPQEKKP